MKPDDIQNIPDASLIHGWLPIREVARQTGVNPITLRAWERRYGLIKPQRSHKGHRLYSTDHISQIREVLGWLQRGVAVSQVRQLLQAAPPPQAADSPWTEQQQQWLHCIEQLAERALDDGLHQALTLYPPELLCQHLLLPLLEHLQLRWQCHPQARLEQVFFHGWLRSRISARIAHDQRQHGHHLQGSAPLLLLNLSDLHIEPELWLTAWLASHAGCPARVLEWSMPAGDLARAIDLLTPRAVLLYASQRLDSGYLPSLLEVIDSPQLLCGHAVSIHHQAWADLPDLHLADTPLAALQCLQRLGLLDVIKEIPCAN